MRKISPPPLDALAQLVGAKHLLTRPDEMRPYLTEWRGTYHGEALCVIKPSSADQTAAIVKLAARQGLHIVPQSGNTGLVGGQIAFDKRRAILLNLARMDKIRAIDPDDNAITAEAGCVLSDLHRAAEKADRLLPLTLASEGSSRLGGLLATNAGGHNVPPLRHGARPRARIGMRPRGRTHMERASRS